MNAFDDSGGCNKPGYIYLIHAKGTRRHKIGLTTRDVEQRFNELNSSQSPYPLDLLHYIATEDVTKTEGYLHQKYAVHRCHGEWFEFSNRQLREVLREFDRLENGDRGWFGLPSISLPSVPSIDFSKWEWDSNKIALLIAGLGVVWLVIGISCSPQQPANQPVGANQKTNI